VSHISDSERILGMGLCGTAFGRVLRLRRCQRMKATIAATISNRPTTPPMIPLVLAVPLDIVEVVVVVGVVVVVALTRMLCTGTLRTGVVSVENATHLKRTLEPTAQTLHLAQDLGEREREIIVRT